MNPMGVTIAIVMLVSMPFFRPILSTIIPIGIEPTASVRLNAVVINPSSTVVNPNFSERAP